MKYLLFTSLIFISLSTSLLAQDHVEHTTKEIVGIGIEFKMDPIDHPEPFITKVAKQFPAHNNGVKPGDIIIKVDHQPTVQMTIEEVTAAIRGEVGTKVTLEVKRGKDNLMLGIERQKIVIKKIEWEELAH